MKKVIFFILLLAGSYTVKAQTSTTDSTEYSLVDGIVKSKFGVFVTLTAEEYDDAPFKDLEVEVMGEIDKEDSKTGVTGWQPIVKARVKDVNKDDIEIELLEDVMVAAAKKGVKFDINKGMAIKIRWPEISY